MTILICGACGKQYTQKRGTKGRVCSRKCWGTLMIGNRHSPLSMPGDFWARVKVGVGDECWEWTGSKTDGYGTLSYQRKAWLAHRLSFFLQTGQLPPNVCHTCDNPGCCNPAHLFPGDHAINNADRHAKGRSRGGRNFGPANPMFGRKRKDVLAEAERRRTEQSNARAAERVR